MGRRIKADKGSFRALALAITAAHVEDSEDFDGKKDHGLEEAIMAALREVTEKCKQKHKQELDEVLDVLKACDAQAATDQWTESFGPSCKWEERRYAILKKFGKLR